MRELTPAVVEFVWDFVVQDVQKVLGCSATEAKDVLLKVTATQGQKLNPNKEKQHYKTQRPVLAKEEPQTRIVKRIKGEYSNKNAWDKYL